MVKLPEAKSHVHLLSISRPGNLSPGITGGCRRRRGSVDGKSWVDRWFMNVYACLWWFIHVYQLVYQLFINCLFNCLFNCLSTVYQLVNPIIDGGFTHPLVVQDLATICCLWHMCHAEHWWLVDVAHILMVKWYPQQLISGILGPFTTLFQLRDVQAI